MIIPKSQNVEFEVLITVVIKSFITPYHTLYVNPTFRRDNRVCCMLHGYGFCLAYFWRGRLGLHATPKRQMSFRWLHGVMSHVMFGFADLALTIWKLRRTVFVILESCITFRKCFVVIILTYSLLIFVSGLNPAESMLILLRPCVPLHTWTNSRIAGQFSIHEISTAKFEAFQIPLNQKINDHFTWRFTCVSADTLTVTR
jgi:hypothetical protein